MKHILKSIFISIITIALLIILSTPFAQIPPLGKFLDPVIGFWRVAWQDEVPKSSEIDIQGLKSEVTAAFDKRGVPHLFGNHEFDVFTAIGYCHAGDRLWQMDIQYRFAAGRLSEVLGRQTLSTDIEQRKLGLLVTAQRIVASLDSNVAEYKILQAYANGVNHFIDELSYTLYPYEFKLLNYCPEPWTIEKTVLVNVTMGYLSRSMDELYFSRLQQIFSEQDLEELYPLFTPIDYPIIPDYNAKLGSNPLTQTEHSNPVKKQNSDKNCAQNNWNDLLKKKEHFGSNNWVVSGSKTTTGKPILANDPHLGLELPSVWYEAHLNCPQFDVYGVTLPGAPFIIIGFNRYIAWGLTNCGWDVTDLYQETFDNQTHDHYLYNGNWQPVEKIPQVIHLKNAPDTTIVLEYTHRGPIIQREGKYYSMQWTGNQTHFDGVSVYWLNKAKNYEDYRQALKFYNCPAQNFVYADVEGNIAMTCAGKNPVRRNGFGRAIADGNTDQFEWISYTQFQQLPSSLNPEQAYLASANQQPINRPEPYFGWNWPTDYRARRINELLKNNNAIDIQDMMKFQTDAHAVRAEVFVPYIFNAFQNWKDLSSNMLLDSVLYYLKNWNYEMRKQEVGATLFDKFMRNFRANTWQDHFPESGRGYLWPDELILEQFTRNAPNSKWFDNTETSERENRDDIIRRSLIEAADQLAEEFGDSVGKWKWKRYHKTTIPHLSRIRVLGIDPFPNNGGFGTLNVGAARTNSFGPSWRMIVSLENPIRAWGVYPGGQSGNPASKHFIDFLNTWKSENYFEMLFPEKPYNLLAKNIESLVTILPKRK